MTGKHYINVLMTADTIGGVWTYCMELCTAMQGYNVELYIVTAGAKLNASQRNEVDGLDNVCVYETSYKLEWMKDPWKDIDASGEYLLRLEKEIQPDVILLNSYSYASLNFKAPKIVVAHSDVYSWWMAVKKDYPTAEWHEYFKRIKAGFEHADLIIAPSLSAMDDIKIVYGICNENIVIYNGRNAELFYQREKLPYIMSMGRIWDEAKNIQLLVDAAPQINYTIKIAGENNFQDESTNLERENIDYLGKLSTKQIADELSAASVFVLPAKYEPFGLSILEAALSGCALILGDIPSLKEIWQDNAVYVNTNDATALAKTVNNLISNKEKLQHYSENAFTHAKKYSSSILAKEYFKQYRQLIFSRKNIKETV